MMMSRIFFRFLNKFHIIIISMIITINKCVWLLDKPDRKTWLFLVFYVCIQHFTNVIAMAKKLLSSSSSSLFNTLMFKLSSFFCIFYLLNKNKKKLWLPLFFSSHTHTLYCRQNFLVTDRLYILMIVRKIEKKTINKD